MKRYLSALAGFSMSAGSALAEVPADVTTALTTAKTDGVAVAGVVLAVIIAIYAFKLIRKAL